MARYEWRIVGWSEEAAGPRVKGSPTEEETRKARVLVVRYTNVDVPEDVRHAIIRSPRGFKEFRGMSIPEYVGLLISDQADHYSMELTGSGDADDYLSA